MSQKNRYADLAKSIAARVNMPKDGTEAPLAPAKSMSAPVKMAVQAIHQGDLEKKLSQAQKEAGASKPIPISLIDESPFQTRKITPEQVEELALNLANNPLSTPVVVRRVGDRFELVAGHRRVAAFKHLGRTEIPGVIQEFNDVDASTALFMDNMYNADLPDYEKYLGLVAYQKSHPESSSQRALAEKTGFSQTQILRLLSFAKMPKQALGFVDHNRRVIGSNVMHALSQLTDVSDKALIDALKLVAAGELKQMDLIKFLNQPGQAKPKAVAKPAELVVKRGKEVFAKVLRSKRKVTINVIDEETATWIEKTIHEALKKKANA